VEKAKEDGADVCDARGPEGLFDSQPSKSNSYTAPASRSIGGYLQSYSLVVLVLDTACSRRISKRDSRNSEFSSEAYRLLTQTGTCTVRQSYSSTGVLSCTVVLQYKCKFKYWNNRHITSSSKIRTIAISSQKSNQEFAATSCKPTPKHLPPYPV
jgi:hypothetical protein